MKELLKEPVGHITKLSNDLKVGNFSSPHPFRFEDGSAIPAVNDIDSQRLKVDFIETVVENHEAVGFDADIYKTISLSFDLSDDVQEEMEKWYKLWQNRKVDIVLCCLPMIQALKEMKDFSDGAPPYLFDLLNSPFRAIRMKDRIKKLISIDTFTI
tara:strand:- start:883 stop:1350 length:468 start_codon:yes stop_codon:yes gene_type:complete